jgi:hypothetical protein
MAMSSASLKPRISWRRARKGHRRPKGWLSCPERLEDRVVPATITVTSLGEAGAGSLRAAIEQGNLDSAKDTITFDPAVRGTITLSTALPDLSAGMEIEGPGPASLRVARSGVTGTPEFSIYKVRTGAEVTISGLTITGGLAINGGGGIDNSGTLTVTDTAISGNSADAIGGGIFNDYGTLTISGSTISNNSAFGLHVPGEGGGVGSFGTLRISDSTISGNRTGGDGGGIANLSGTLTISDSTISENTAGGDGGGIAGAVTLTGTILDDPGGNVFGSLSSLGHNLFSDTPGSGLDPTDQINTAPLLGPLADNGGPTFTRALLPGSPAIDGGVAVVGVTTDQRGVSRPQGAAPDIGAFEAVGVPGTRPPTVTGLRRSGSRLLPTRLVLTFSSLLDPAGVRLVRNYSLVPTGQAGRINSRVIPIASAVYDPISRTVTLTPRHRLSLHLYYRLTVNGAVPNGLKSVSGVPLDGSGQGQQGSNYVAVVHGFDTTKPEAVPAGPRRVR